MLIEDLLGKSPLLSMHEKRELMVNCSQFIEESNCVPLYKSLPVSYQNFQRVKVRMRKRTTELSEVYNSAFNHNYSNIRQRAVFASAVCPTYTSSADTFFIFPTNGYKFLYCKEVADSSNDYQLVLDTLFEQFHNTDIAAAIVTDLLKYTYISENLYDGIVAKAEIILYSIPQYYAIRVNTEHEYADIIK